MDGGDGRSATWVSLILQVPTWADSKAAPKPLVSKGFAPLWACGHTVQILFGFITSYTPQTGHHGGSPGGAWPGATGEENWGANPGTANPQLSKVACGPRIRFPGPEMAEGWTSQGLGVQRWRERVPGTRRGQWLQLCPKWRSVQMHLSLCFL